MCVTGLKYIVEEINRTTGSYWCSGCCEMHIPCFLEYSPCIELNLG